MNYLIRTCPLRTCPHHAFHEGRGNESCNSKNFLEEHISAVDDIVNGENVERILNEYENYPDISDNEKEEIETICQRYENLGTHKRQMVYDQEEREENYLP